MYSVFKTCIRVYFSKGQFKLDIVSLKNTRDNIFLSLLLRAVHETKETEMITEKKHDN